MSWSQILGHADRIESFRQIVARNRLAHAYLFVGPPGVGKRRFAQELAKALLCEAPRASSLDACDHCDACHLVDAGTHPDLFAVSRPEDKNEMPIEVLKELCRNFSLKSARGHGKIGILDDADDLNDESANCFLKTLEEPPPGSMFILIGTGSERQLPTIRSRCQLVHFSSLNQEAMAAWFDRQGITDRAQRARLVRLSGGSPGQALALADEALWQFRGRLLRALFRPDADSVALSRQFIEFVEEAGKDSASQRRRASLVLRLLIAFLEDALAMSVGETSRPSGSE